MANKLKTDSIDAIKHLIWSNPLLLTPTIQEACAFLDSIKKQLEDLKK